MAIEGTTMLWKDKIQLKTDQEKLDKAPIELLPLIKPRGGITLGGDVISDARADVSQDGKTFEVSMQMNAQGAKKWKKMTAAAASNPQNKRRIAIILDNYAVSAPTVQNEIPNGSSSIATRRPSQGSKK